MAISVQQNFTVSAPLVLDDRTKFDNLTDALTTLTLASNRRVQSLTVFITNDSDGYSEDGGTTFIVPAGDGTPKEYWFKDGITDTDFIVKTVESSTGVTMDEVEDAIDDALGEIVDGINRGTVVNAFASQGQSYTIDGIPVTNGGTDYADGELVYISTTNPNNTLVSGLGKIVTDGSGVVTAITLIRSGAFKVGDTLQAEAGTVAGGGLTFGTITTVQADNTTLADITQPKVGDYAYVAQYELAANQLWRFDFVEVDSINKWVPIAALNELPRNFSVEKIQTGEIEDKAVGINQLADFTVTEKADPETTPVLTGSLTDILADFDARITEAKAQAADGSYQNTGTVVTVGGIAAGTTLDGTISEILDLMFNPYQSPVVTLTIAPSAVQESGTTVGSIVLTAQVTKKTKPLTGNVTFKLGGVTLDTQAVNPNGGTFTYTHSTAVTQTSAFSVEVTDGQTTGTNGKTLTFYNPSFYGISATAIPTEPILQSLTKDLRGVKGRTCNLLGSGFAMYAYPASYGLLGQITDHNGFNVTSGFILVQQDYTMSGSPVAYNVYVAQTTATYGGVNYKFE